MSVRILIILFFSLAFGVQCQIPNYFNNVYNPENTFAAGRGILQIDNGYYGMFGTKLSNNSNNKITIFKMDLSGNIVDWITLGENWHHYWAGELGGILIETTDGNLAFATHVSDTVYAHGILIKLNLELDTLWKKEYHSEVTNPMTWNVSQTTDGGYIMVGIDYPGGTYYDGLLLKADSMGVEEWRQIYGAGTIYSEYLTNVIETPDGGYLIGGMRKETEYLDHALDAMLIKTDSQGNEQWTKCYGNPNVDDDMAHVSMADDGNYLVATVYGEWVVSPTSRTGRIRLLKIDNNGNTIWDKKIGPKERNVYLKNLRHTTDGNLILSGWAYNDTVTDWIYEGLLYKFTQEGDSIWMRDYNYFNNQYDQNFFYDASPTSDNGYIAVGQARPDMGGSTNKMWVVKVDSMGCDTPGCATGVWEIEFPEITNGEIMVWPNPVSRKFRVSGFGPGHTEVMLRRPTEGRPSRNIEVWSGGNRVIRIYNSQGLKLDEVKVPDNVESLEIDASGYVNGLYYLQFIVSDKVVQSRKFIKIK